MQTLTIRNAATISTSNARLGSALVRAGAAGRGPARTATTFLATLLRALSAWAV